MLYAQENSLFKWEVLFLLVEVEQVYHKCALLQKCGYFPLDDQFKDDVILRSDEESQFLP